MNGHRIIDGPYWPIIYKPARAQSTYRTLFNESSSDECKLSLSFSLSPSPSRSLCIRVKIYPSITQICARTYIYGYYIIIILYYTKYCSKCTHSNPQKAGQKCISKFFGLPDEWWCADTAFAIIKLNTINKISFVFVCDK